MPSGTATKTRASGGNSNSSGSKSNGLSTHKKLEIALPIAIGVLLLLGILYCCGFFNWLFGLCQPRGDQPDSQPDKKPGLKQIKKFFG